MDKLGIVPPDWSNAARWGLRLAARSVLRRRFLAYLAGRAREQDNGHTVYGYI